MRRFTALLLLIGCPLHVPADLGAINAMASDANGALYAVGRGSGHQLVTINPVTGVMTFIGVLAFESDALAFAPIPEPSTYAFVLGAACLGLVALCRRK
jgi:hypothetical protein